VSATIREVARRAGVSVATVSRVLNDKGPVLDETRRRVQVVARRLRYAPHGAARSLITRRTSTVGVLLPDIYGEFFSEAIRGVDLAARRSGYHVLVSSSHSDKSEIENAVRAMRGRVDGLIVMCPDIRARDLERSLPDAVPVVLLHCSGNGKWVDSIDLDNAGGAYEMVRHFFSLGHRRIAHIRGAAGNHDADERLRGYRAAMTTFVGARIPELEVEGDFTDHAGYVAGKRLLECDPAPTAIFAANDAMAIGCLSALVEGGRRVPEDVSLGGFDDIPIARFTTPPLTTVRVSIAELGARSLERLLLAISLKNRHERRHETVPTTLVVRSSSGAAAPSEGRARSHRSDFRKRRIQV
jgi:LacI family transcriptional regulator, galactose operon repressor